MVCRLQEGGRKGRHSRTSSWAGSRTSPVLEEFKATRDGERKWTLSVMHRPPCSAIIVRANCLLDGMWLGCLLCPCCSRGDCEKVPAAMWGETASLCRT